MSAFLQKRARRGFLAPDPGAARNTSRSGAIDSFDQVRKAGPLEFRPPKCARSQRPSNWQGASSTSTRSHQRHHGASIWSLRSLPHREKGAEESGRSSCVSIVTVGSLCKLGDASRRQMAVDPAALGSTARHQVHPRSRLYGRARAGCDGRTQARSRANRLRSASEQ